MRPRSKVLIAIPAYNEAEVIEGNIKKLREFLTSNFDREYEIVVADNASTDSTAEKVMKLSQECAELKWIHLGQKGKGGAIKKAWAENDADIVSILDADLSPDLSAFPQLFAALDDGYDVAIGSRLLKGSKVKRSFKRSFLSRGYNLLLRLLFRAQFSDAQCGFKAMKKRAFLELLPTIKNNEWFFDTELLIRSQRKGLKIKEIPINWVERRESKEQPLKAVFNYIVLLRQLYFELRSNDHHEGADH